MLCSLCTHVANHRHHPPPPPQPDTPLFFHPAQSSRPLSYLLCQYLPSLCFKSKWAKRPKFLFPPLLFFRQSISTSPSSFCFFLWPSCSTTWFRPLGAFPTNHYAPIMLSQPTPTSNFKGISSPLPRATNGNPALKRRLRGVPPVSMSSANHHIQPAFLRECFPTIALGGQ